MRVPLWTLLLVTCWGPLLGLAWSAHAQARAPTLQDVRGLLGKGQPEAALEAVEAFLAEAKDDRQGRFFKGVILSELGRAPAAITVFESLVADYPDLPEPHNNLAVLYASGGELDKARDALLHAIAIHPGYAIAHENLGDIYARMAEVAYRRATELDGSNNTANQKLSQLSEVTGLAGAASVASAARSGDALRPAKPVTAAPAASSASVAVAAATATQVNVAAPAASAAELRAVVESWASHWSNQDVEAYLGSYADSFRPARGLSRASWRAQRRQRLARPGSIQVSISNFKVTSASAERARVTFQQAYQSETYSDRVLKQLDLVRSDGAWRIRSERSLGKL